MSDLLVIAGRSFRSRLIVGTGKYRSHQEMVRAHEASGAEMVTVAVRRVNLTDRTKESLLDYIDRKRFFILPNTAGCYTADEAIRTARLGREVGLSEWVKLEVIGDQQTLFPDTEELIKATRILVKEGFVVLPYTNDDLVVARKLIDAGAAAVMPLGAPIGSGMGIQNHANLRILRDAIDNFKQSVDLGLIGGSDVELGSEGYPKDLEMLVEGVSQVGTVDKKLKFLRRIPMDPMTHSVEWGLRSYQDEPDSMNWGGRNVYDVYTTSRETALDGTNYRDW